MPREPEKREEGATRKGQTRGGEERAEGLRKEEHTRQESGGETRSFEVPGSLTPGLSVIKIPYNLNTTDYPRSDFTINLYPPPCHRFQTIQACLQLQKRRFRV